jgi:hypothetical protein
MIRTVKCLWTVALLSGPSLCSATTIIPKSLTNLVADADHVLVGKVTLVDMVDGNGKQVTDLEAHTGPALSNVIRLHVDVETNGVLYTTSQQVPAGIVIPLWPMWHYSLRQIKKVEGTVGIFLLKGKDFGAVYPGGFHRDLSEKAEIEALLTSKRKPSSSPQPVPPTLP